jgi:hypothetical protein
MGQGPLPSWGRGFNYAQTVLENAESGTTLEPRRRFLRQRSNAPEWTRTTTDHTVHKALNLARLPIPPQAQPGEYSAGPLSGSSRWACPTGPCIHPSAALLYEHMFVSHADHLERSRDTWI